MSFWGVEVKPGNPLIINSEDLVGRLILSQATLGTGSATKKSTLQVKIGDKSPVFLCTLLPDKSESCSLSLEFDEDEDVTFSVLGPTSIHISGFVQCETDNDYNSDSYSEDESEGSDSESEDDYEDEYIDDVDMLPRSASRKSGVVIEEIVDDEKDPSEDGGTKQAKKKKHLADADKKEADQQIVKSDAYDSLFESEDEDGFPASSSVTVESKKKKKNKKDEAKVDDGSAKSLKRKVDVIDHVDEQKSDANGDASESKKKKKQKKKKGKTEKDEEVVNVKQAASTEDKSISKTDNEAKESKDKSAKIRTYPNGLVVEEISMGKPNGKRASRGSKVSVHYIGKLQKNNKHFDSNTGGNKPFKFRLGIGQVIKGWDVGLEGMRVGDKRRLTIPPSMGYGASGAPPKIPPNAWLLFDVELVDVA